MINITIVFAFICLCVIAFFIWQLRRIRTHHPIVKQCVAAIECTRDDVITAGASLKTAVAIASESLKGDMTTAEIEARAVAAKSREPITKDMPTEETPPLRDGRAPLLFGEVKNEKATQGILCGTP